jgi:DNA-binding CsgD family transcriptional regulator
MLNLGTALSQDWPVPVHLDWIERATALLPRVQAAERLHLAALRVSALLALGEEEGWRAAAGLRQVGSTPSEQRTILLSLADIGRLAIKWGRYAEARMRLSSATELSRAAGYQPALSAVHAGCAYLDWYTGRWPGLARTVVELAEAETTEQQLVRLEAREIQGLLELATGARKAAERRLRATLDAFARDAPPGYQCATTAAALGRLRLAEGTAEGALRVTGPVMARIAQKGLWLWATDAIPVHLDALTRVGELARAEDLAEHFAGWPAGRDAPAPAAASVLCRAIVTEACGDLHAAAELFARAADAWAGLPRPYDELLALERQGRCLLAAGEPDRGVAVLSLAQQRLKELGARWDADRAARSLRQYGVEVSRSWRGGPHGYGDQLSPREQEVVALVARGMTNRDIGRVMFLSPRTVGYHLSRAMRKLGVSTRTSAAMAAAEAGVIPPVRDEPVREVPEESPG